jgi:DNA end-binding protein Ku
MTVMRSIWKGAITFGLVNVPVKLYSATEDHDVSLHQVHDADGGRIRYQRRCEICGKVVDYEHIDKAFDDGDQTVVLTADDLKSLPEERSREIDVLEFVPSDQLDPLMFDRSYFLEPDSRSPKAYVLLRRTLEETERTAIVHFSLRQKTRLAALRVRGDVLVLQTLLWDDEVREARFPVLDEKVRISGKELDMSGSLVESLGDDFDPSQFGDDYQEELRKLIDAKLEEGDSLDTDATFGRSGDDDDGAGGGSGEGEVIDLMEALRQSVERSRSGARKTPAKKPAATTTSASEKKAPEKKAPEKKTPEKKTPARKPAAKESAAKKSATKKPAAEKSAAKEPAAEKPAAKKSAAEKKAS